MHNSNQIYNHIEFILLDLKGHCDEKVDGIYKHPFNCDRYVECSNKVAYSVPCGPGLHYDDVNKVCDKPESAACFNRYKHGASAVDATICSTIGKNILKKGGNAVDAAIAGSLCSGTVNQMWSGIGGGGFMVVYDAKTKKSIAYDFRETAPSAANETMYNGRSRASRGIFKEHFSPNFAVFFQYPFLQKCSKSKAVENQSYSKSILDFEYLT